MVAMTRPPPLVAIRVMLSYQCFRLASAMVAAVPVYRRQSRSVVHCHGFASFRSRYTRDEARSGPIRDIGIWVHGGMRPSILAKSAAAVFATAAVGGLSSRRADSSWYARLRKPAFQPPPQWFPIVWPILYADIAVVSASTIDRLQGQRPQHARVYVTLLSANLVLNASWTWLFFSRRRLGGAAVTAGVLTASSADLTRRAIDARGSSAAVLGLYPLWCAFATVLSTCIWQMNR
jgi:translocator protein